MADDKKVNSGRMGGLARQAKARELRNGNQFEVRISETGDGPGNVLVSEGVEYYYVDGVDIIRLPYSERATKFSDDPRID